MNFSKNADKSDYLLWFILGNPNQSVNWKKVHLDAKLFDMVQNQNIFYARLHVVQIKIQINDNNLIDLRIS